MRLLAVGDIHGCFTALTALASFVPLTDDDLIVALGDYVDRGPDSRAVLDWVIARHARDLLVPLRGNHDLMMLRARDGWEEFRTWLGYGGDAALRSYGRDGRTGQIDDVPEAHWEFLEKETCAFYETDTHFFVHANAYADVPLRDQPDHMLYWEMFNDPPPHESGKVMVCGHTRQRSGVPRSIGHAVCIDTWVYGDGWLTCLDVATGKYWQANQQGQTRTGFLEDET